jgi:hypothetical protein
MPIRQFLLVNLAKNLGHAYRRRSVEAIRLCRKLEQDLLAKSRVGIHTSQPGTIQNVTFIQTDNNLDRFVNSSFAPVCIVMLFRILDAVWEAVELASSTHGKNRNTDLAFDVISDLLRDFSSEKSAPSIERCSNVPIHTRGSFSEPVQPRTSQKRR